MGYQVKLSHHIITHWMQMDDIKGLGTICMCLLAAKHVGFGSDYLEESKTFDQRQQKTDLASLHRWATRSSYHMILSLIGCIKGVSTICKCLLAAKHVGFFCSDYGEKSNVS
jgi:phage terminase large subunit-like protein